MMNELRTIPLLNDVPDAELSWLWEHGRVELLAEGAYFFHQGGPSDRFYIVLTGELQISRRLNGQEVIMGTTPPGIMAGQVSMLNRLPSHVSARAIVPTRLLVFDEGEFRHLIAACPVYGQSVLQAAAERMQTTMNTLNQQETMAALGKLSAALAHELNNPAAAVRRAATSLKECLPTVQAQAFALSGLGLSAAQVERLADFQRGVIARVESAPALSPLEQSEREEALGDWLDAQGVEESWALADAFVSAGLSADDLAALAPPPHAPAIIAWLHRTLDAAALLHTVEHSAQRISALVASIKSYTYMDRSPVQDVNLHAGLDSSVLMLSHKLREVEIEREYDPHLPTIEGHGSVLNQVWINLIDNALDAVGGSGRIRLITRHEADYVMVEVQDDGPGIPPDVLPRLFEPFFTTKAVGLGTGLGLDISYRIVQQHGGTIEARSEPGRTRFIVRLPVHQPNSAGETGDSL